MFKQLFVASLVVAAANCKKKSPIASTNAPVIIIDSPQERASIVDSDTVFVKGHLENGANTQVTVNGTKVKLDSEFKFSLQVPLEDVALIHVHAESTSDLRDNAVIAAVRSSTHKSDEVQEDGIMIRSTQATLDAVSDVAKISLGDLNLSDTMKQQNPVAVNSKKGKLLAEVNVESLNANVDDLKISLKGDRIVTTASIGDIESNGEVKNHIALIKRWRDYKATADNADFSAEWKLSNLKFEVFEPNMDIKDLKIDSSIIVELANFILNFEKKLENALEKKLKSEVANQLTDKLSATALDTEINLYDKKHLLKADIDHVVVGEHGVIVSLSSQISIDGTPEPHAVFSPLRTFSDDEKAFREKYDFNDGFDMSQTQAMQLAVHENFVNQVLSAVWHSKALNRSFAFKREEAGGILSKIEVYLPLPPMLAAVEGKGYNLKIGAMEVGIFVRGKEKEAMRIRMNLDTLGNVDYDPVADRPRLFLKNLDLQTETIHIDESLLTANQAEEMIGLLEPELKGMINNLLAKLLLPRIPGLSGGNMSATGRGPYLLIHGDLRASDK